MALDRDETFWTLRSHAATVQTPVLNWKSAWTDTGVTYQPSDVVSNDGSSWVCIKTHIGGDDDNEPGVGANTAVYWDLLALSGDIETATISILIFDDSQTVSVGDGAGEVFYRIPTTLNLHQLMGVAAQVSVAGTTGTTDIQVHNVTQAVDMLTTKMTIDSGEIDTSTAAAPPIIDTANNTVATADTIRFDVDAVSTTAPIGLLVELQFRLP